MENPTKRMKMHAQDDPEKDPPVPGTSNSEKIATPAFDFDSSDFATILKTSAFVDKTLLIEAVLRSPRFLLVTAPRRFGKSTNINMLKTFLEIEVDEEGKPKTKANYLLEPVRDTPNYALFVDNKLKITKQARFMNKHFGRHPVLYLDFKCDGIIKCFDDALTFYKSVVHKCFQEHKYLTESEKLDVDQKQVCKKWCDDANYKQLDECNLIVDGLKILSEYLIKHFNRKKLCSYVLVDDCDSVVRRAMLDVEDREQLDKIVRLSSFIMTEVLRGCSRYLDRGFVTGISHIGTWCYLLRIKWYKFLRQHKFINFYGLTEEEVAALFNNPIFQLDWEAIDTAYRKYDAYSTQEGRNIYSTWSVLHFLKEKKAECYWRGSGLVRNLAKAFQIPHIREQIEALVQNQRIEVVDLELLDQAAIAKLQNVMLQPQANKNYYGSLFFIYLLEQGYFMYIPQDRPSAIIPSEEIREEFIQKLEEYYTEVCTFDIKLVDACASLFNNINPSATVNDLKDILQELYEKLKELFQEFWNGDCIELNKTAFRGLMLFVLRRTTFKWSSQIHVRENRSDVLLVKNDCSIVLQTECDNDTSDECTSRAALKQILTDRYYNEFENEEPSPGAIRRLIFIGLSIDNDLNPSISCLVNSKDISMAVHVPRST